MPIIIFTFLMNYSAGSVTYWSILNKINKNNFNNILNVQIDLKNNILLQ